MNKLEGFLELNTLALNSVPWQRYTGSETLDKNTLWTVRTAVIRGHDFNLPRKVGVPAGEAEAFAKELLQRFNKEDYIIYYPYFIAEKSGTLQVSHSRTIIEAVDKDLWNLLTYNHRDVTIIQTGGAISVHGNGEFLAKAEVQLLLDTADYIRRRYRSTYMSEGALLLEWSFAYESDASGNPKGERELVFIELKKVKG